MCNKALNLTLLPKKKGTKGQKNLNKDFECVRIKRKDRWDKSSLLLPYFIVNKKESLRAYGSDIMKNERSKARAFCVIAIIICLVFSLAACLVGCSGEKKQNEDDSFLVGVYQTESQTGSFVRYTFTKEHTYECEVYTLEVLTAERKGTYKIEKGEISLLREGESDPDIFPLELQTDGIVINGTFYKKMPS